MKSPYIPYSMFDSLWQQFAQFRNQLPPDIYELYVKYYYFG